MKKQIVLDDICWEIKLPIKNEGYCSSKAADWLAGLQEMRGRILYENGLRPYFNEGEHCLDSDNFDLASYHILAKINDKIVGCVRLLPLSLSLDCVTSEIVGRDKFRQILTSVFDNVSKLCEASRWIVDPDYQATMVGYYLAYALWALTEHLECNFVANAGQKTKKLLYHYGGVYFADDFGPYYSEKYNDSVYVLYFDKKKLSEVALKHIHKMSILLNLTNKIDLVAIV